MKKEYLSPEVKVEKFTVSDTIYTNFVSGTGIPGEEVDRDF